MTTAAEAVAAVVVSVSAVAVVLLSARAGKFLSVVVPTYLAAADI